ncbi:MAG: Asp-tRNA(Asn)/Glu-tRNA(Gln) amidotransferase subunit GatB [bacterium]|nr:Asp-tRNA(Asn)/Glu-tRNA(Gln) amidotransferase subunit GatB [bacterium]MCZ6701107.1 Asp-tRNA(Asn)/Glu-tRNA(Gln) amidotransferase subunit GatB [bacterium]MDV2479397.1 Asp-tRNA(Asn)/Glu-tRNA(Gln) amidotransferase subunit GatB [bacterium]
MEYEVVIGLEVHAQLLTHSKVFCRCSAAFGADANTQTCPICTGMPGVLPVINREAVSFAIKTALTVGATIQPLNRFARKNYFYPDLPKGYQISQYEQPLATGGKLAIEVNGQTKEIGITRIHMEEDAGKLFHGENLGDPEASFVDFNRCGVPLLEIVSEPDLRSPEEARLYLQKLRQLLRYLEVCDGNMEEGSFRCDANVSIRPVGSKELGTKAELKNMNSFRHVKHALEYEVARQQEALEAGEAIVQETRLWDPSKSITISMRSKEEAQDYRYFPEPDLVPLVVDEAWLEEVRSTLPELPDAKRARFEDVYGLPAYDAGVLTATRALADYYEAAVEAFADDPKMVSNWVMSELLGLLNRDGREITESPVDPGGLAGLLRLMADGTISGKIAKEVFEEMYATGRDAEAIVEERGLEQISDAGELEALVVQVLSENPDAVERYRSGKTQIVGFLVGQVMKATKGQANPKIVNELLLSNLAS